MRYEVEVVQTTFEKMLRDNGTHFTREDQMPLHGKADFVVHGRFVRVLIECKRNCDSIERSIAQVIGYRAQLLSEDVVAAIVVPQGTTTAEAYRLCAKYGVRLITIKVKSIREYELDRIFAGATPMVASNGNGRETEPIA